MFVIFKSYILSLFCFLLFIPVASSVSFEEIASDIDIIQSSRPSLSENGKVAFFGKIGRTSDAVFVGEGGPLTSFDLSSSNFAPLTPVNFRNRVLQVRNSGDITFMARKTSSPGCAGVIIGVYETNLPGTSFQTLKEICEDGMGSPEKIHPELSMSKNGTIAFNSIINGSGKVFRKPVSGSLTDVFLGSGIFFNTTELDVNDSGSVVVNTEYLDGSVGGLMRGVVIFTIPGVDRADLDFAVEKMGLGTRAPLAINNSGQVVLSLSTTVTYLDGGSSATHTIEPGIYISTPQRFNTALNSTPTNLVQIANTAGGYCGFGNVDIRDDGEVVFEARLGSGSDCNSGGFDGIFMGPDPDVDVVVKRGDPALTAHQFFDSIRLGTMNNSDSVAILTTYSEPLVHPTKIWKIALEGLTRSGDAEDSSASGYWAEFLESLIKLLSELYEWILVLFNGIF